MREPGSLLLRDEEGWNSARNYPGDTVVTAHETLRHSIEELEMQLNKHRQVLESVLENRSLKSKCIWSDCHHQQMLLSLLVESVQVLDETRKSFKSKQLEQLRKKLLQVLTEVTDCSHAQKSAAQLEARQN